MTQLVLQVVARAATQFDVVASISGQEIGRLEAGYVGDGGIQRFWIGNIRVAPGHRRGGVGRSMANEALRQGAARFGADCAFIDAVPHDDSTADGLQAFWSSLGFTEYLEPIPLRARQGTFMKAFL